MPQVTMKDVAESAGVSTATVSHVINGTRFVQKETKQAVLSAMQSLGYQPNSIARSLRSGETKTIGLVVPDASNPFFADISRRIENIGYENGYSVILCNSDNDLKKQRDYVSTLISKQVDGVFFISAGDSRDDLQRLLESGIPVVIADRNMPLELADIVLLDNEEAGYRATEHLIHLGHRRIGCITGPTDISPSMHRVSGFQRALDEYGLTFDKQLVLPGDFSIQSGIRAMGELLDLDPPPTAVFALNDMMAIGAISAAHRKGLQVPEDHSVIGFDDIELASAVEPALTTMAQPLQEIAQKATYRLLEKMNTVGDDWQNEKYVLQATLVVRESTARVKE